MNKYSIYKILLIYIYTMFPLKINSNLELLSLISVPFLYSAISIYYLSSNLVLPLMVSTISSISLYLILTQLLLSQGLLIEPVGLFCKNSLIRSSTFLYSFMIIYMFTSMVYAGNMNIWVVLFMIVLFSVSSVTKLYSCCTCVKELFTQTLLGGLFGSLLCYLYKLIDEMLIEVPNHNCNKQ